MNTAVTPISAMRRSYWVVGAVAAAAHLVLFLLDMVSPDGFLRADRARFRLHAIEHLLDARLDHQRFIACLVDQGNIGDYGIHAIFYGLGGPLAVIAAQITLALAAVLCVTYISWRVFGTEKLAIAGGLLYSLLPQSVAFPHQLLSEALSNPFLIFATAGVAHALERPVRIASWCLAGLCFGVAALVRPALVLLPLIAAGLLLVLDRARARPGQLGALVAAGFAPFMLWSTFMFAHTGSFGPGESKQDLGVNFAQSTGKVLLSEGRAPANGSTPQWLPQRLTLSEYLGYVWMYPGGFANLYLKNTVVMLTDSGIGHLYVDVLGFGASHRVELQDPGTGWRAQLTNTGPWAMLRALWRVAPGTMLAGLLGGVGFALVNAGLLAAYVVLLRSNSLLRSPANSLQLRWCLAFLLVVPVYVIVTSQVVSYAPSRLRSQAEFAWAILACYGWAAMLARRSTRT